MTDINKVNNFQKSFEQFGGLGLSYSKMLQLLNKQLSQDSSVSFFEIWIWDN